MSKAVGTHFASETFVSDQMSTESSIPPAPPEWRSIYCVSAHSFPVTSSAPHCGDFRRRGLEIGEFAAESIVVWRTNWEERDFHGNVLPVRFTDVDMTTILSTKGQIVIPGEIRERQGLRPGDELEIEEDRDAIVIRKKRRNEGLIAHLQACPVKGFKAPRMSGNLRSAKF